MAKLDPGMGAALPRGVACGGVPPFDRHFFASDRVVSRIGTGALGAKAERLAAMQQILAAELPPGRWRGVELGIPRMVVLATDAYDAFLARNHLDETALAALCTLPDERIAHAFLHASLPADLVGDLRALAEHAHAPLAVRSSSLLEDSLRLPFAGVYQTKMIPNQDPDPGARFQALVEAVKLVYASTFFAAARGYRAAAGVPLSAEKMAVVVQEIVGRRHGDRFYPHLSAVARSYNYYPRPPATPDAGVADLALGLGKTIVEGGRCWSYSPRYPKAPAPFASAAALMHETQNRFWAVNMGPPPAYDPIAETEYLVEATLADAEYDDTLRDLVSSWDAAADRLRPGTGYDGPRVLDFAPLLLLNEYPLNDVVRALLAVCERVLGGAVEIELAATLPVAPGEGMRVGFLQVRPMATPGERVDVGAEEYAQGGLLLRSREAMGNGALDTVRDVVYVQPDRFEPRLTRDVATEVAALNRRLVAEGRPYLLIGFGRWGSSEPWLGPPVQWADVAGAAVIVEAATAGMNVEPSQGAHFFHNLVSLGVLYLTVREGRGDIDWAGLERQPAEGGQALLRHVRLPAPLRVRVDGRSRRGIVAWPEPGQGQGGAA